MDKGRRIWAIIVSIFMIANILMMMSMKGRINDLHNEIDRMNAGLTDEIRRTNQDVNNLRNDLISKIEKSESLLASFETEVEYKNGQILYTIDFVPKEKRNDEIIFLSIEDEKKEIVSTNGSSYTATLALMKHQSELAPIISFESPTGIRQEALPRENLNELFSLGYDSSLENEGGSAEEDKKILKLTVYTRDVKASSLLSGTPTATAVIEDASTNAEIARKKMQFEEAGAALEKEKTKAVSFTADLSEYGEKGGPYAVWVEIETENGIFYREQVASFYGEYNVKKERVAEFAVGTGVLYPVW
ncbi:hypothetical protein [Mahella australiensis]|uniref:Uncharacterized protein n=1 Tax=Mahella australiensis (strain DSM 15567 / CIP 107919 / 50-1 BON) TaxID=697281 RepID=F3ZXM2_MAHA5|nr:hypothetical protein [Mahella australiensis]AEE95529.1 hypothetical protein Mahau_0313 [Mahella australiensis 50-1 BON]